MLPGVHNVKFAFAAVWFASSSNEPPLRCAPLRRRFRCHPQPSCSAPANTLSIKPQIQNRKPVTNLKEPYPLPYPCHQPYQIAVVLNRKRYDALEQLHALYYTTTLQMLSACTPSHHHGVNAGSTHTCIKSSTNALPSKSPTLTVAIIVVLQAPPSTSWAGVRGGEGGSGRWGESDCGCMVSNSIRIIINDHPTPASASSTRNARTPQTDYHSHWPALSPGTPTPANSCSASDLPP